MRAMQTEQMDRMNSPTGKTYWSVTCNILKVLYSLITVLSLLLLLFGLPMWVILKIFVLDRNMSAANCGILEVLQNDRYNISVFPIDNTSLPYTSIAEAKKEGFKDFQRGQKLKCFYSEDNRHSYLKWQVQFHSDRKYIPFVVWFTPEFLMLIVFYAFIYGCLWLYAKDNMETKRTSPQPSRFSCSKVFGMLFFILVFALSIFGLPIAYILDNFVFRGNLNEASCAVSKVLPNDHYKISVTPIVSILEEFTLVEQAAKKGFHDLVEGKNLSCYFAERCLAGKRDGLNCVVQFHSRLREVRWNDILGFLLCVLISILLVILLVCASYKYCVLDYMVKDKKESMKSETSHEPTEPSRAVVQETME